MGEKHEFYTVMIVLIITSIILQVAFNIKTAKYKIKKMQALNGVFQLIMGPLDINKEKWKFFLNIVNYFSVGLSYGIVAIDVIKMSFGLGEPVI